MSVLRSYQLFFWFLNRSADDRTLTAQQRALLKRARRQTERSLKRTLTILRKNGTVTATTDALTFAPKPVQEALLPFWLTLRLFPIAVFLGLFVALGVFYSLSRTYSYIFENLPAPTELTERGHIVSSRIVDRNGIVLYELYKDENRTLVPLAEIPIELQQATIAIEDQNFYHHFGFSIRGITRAFFSNQSEGSGQQGGSTITQQLVKNRLLTSERTLQRKIKELILSVMVETIYTKEEILELYLNQVAYGGSAYGVEAAAQRYFGKSVRDLSLSESAFLAGLPAAPSLYNPFGTQPDVAFARQREVLRRMVEDGYIGSDAARLAYQEQLAFNQDLTSIQAPHFVMYVRDLLEQEYGEELLTTGGLRITTTLDLKTQQFAQETITAEIDSLAGLRVTNGAGLVTNPQTGEILAMVGSTDYFNFEDDGQVNVTIRPRQPGSSIKPLTYALALEKRLITPTTRIDDSPITYRVAGSPPYSPKNYDGRYHGRVTVRESLGSSYNIPAVKTLAQLGVDTILDRAAELGITTWQDRKRFGLSLTLGGGEVLMTDMAVVYGTFATNGYRVPLNPILEITDYNGTVLYRNECALDGNRCLTDRVLTPGVGYQITSILSDNVARTPAFGPVSTLSIPNQEVAVKTGTTNNLRDNWTIGYTTDRLVAVWVGNNDNRPMSYVASGITGASPIWSTIMRSLLDDSDPHQFAQPSEIVLAPACIPPPGCRTCPVTTDVYLRGTEPTERCVYRRPEPSADTTSTDENGGQILEGMSVER